MMNENKIVLVCSRCDDKPRNYTKLLELILGSVVSRCEECDAPVWISPDSTEAQIDYDATILCPFCAEETSDKRPATLKRFGNEIIVIPATEKGYLE